MTRICIAFIVPAAGASSPLRRAHGQTGRKGGLGWMSFFITDLLFRDMVTLTLKRCNLSQRKDVAENNLPGSATAAEAPEQ
jgi:hypothetical protein